MSYFSPRQRCSNFLESDINSKEYQGKQAKLGSPPTVYIGH